MPPIKSASRASGASGDGFNPRAKSGSKNKGHRLSPGEIPPPKPTTLPKGDNGGFITCDRRCIDLDVDEFLHAVPLVDLKDECIPGLLLEKQHLSPEDRHKGRTLEYKSGLVEENQSVVMRYHKSKVNRGSTAQ